MNENMRNEEVHILNDEDREYVLCDIFRWHGSGGAFVNCEGLRVDSNDHSGIYDSFFNNIRYSSFEAAVVNDDFIKVDLVQDCEGILYFKSYHVKNPADSYYRRLEYQHPVFGIDILDDARMIECVQCMPAYLEMWGPE